MDHFIASESSATHAMTTYTGTSQELHSGPNSVLQHIAPTLKGPNLVLQDIVRILMSSPLIDVEIVPKEIVEPATL